MKREESWEKCFFSIQNGDVGPRWRLAMQVQDHVLPLHLSEHGIKQLLQGEHFRDIFDRGDRDDDIYSKIALKLPGGSWFARNKRQEIVDQVGALPAIYLDH